MWGEGKTLERGDMQPWDIGRYRVIPGSHRIRQRPVSGC